MSQTWNEKWIVISLFENKDRLAAYSIIQEQLELFLGETISFSTYTNTLIPNIQILFANSFNYPIGQTAVGVTQTHLSNQCYTMCIRRESGRCYICFQAVIITATFPAQASFGLR